MKISHLLNCFFILSVAPLLFSQVPGDDGEGKLANTVWTGKSPWANNGMIVTAKFEANRVLWTGKGSWYMKYEETGDGYTIFAGKQQLIVTPVDGNSMKVKLGKSGEPSVFRRIGSQGADVSAEKPTDISASGNRQWSSTAGTQISATAVHCDGKTVWLKTETGKKMKVPMKQFVPKDQQFLVNQFDLQGLVRIPGQPVKSSVPLHDLSLSRPKGKVVGPIKSDSPGSSYFLYIPTTLKKDRPAPLLFATWAGGGKSGGVSKYVPSAERLGWVVALSVQSKNGQTGDQNHAHSKACIDHLTNIVPIDPDRLYFTGGSGGGSMSMYNCYLFEGAGAMPVIGYSKVDHESGHFFVIGGTTDYNRYISADIAARHGDDAIHRFFAGGHGGNDKALVNEGIAWMHAKFLAENRKDHAEECLDYEFRMIHWIKGELASKKPHQAYYWANFLLGKPYQMEGHNRTVLEEIRVGLSNESNQRYAAGIVSLDDFSKTVYHAASDRGSRYGHTTPGIKREAEKLALDLQGVPELEKIASQLGNSTVKGGGKKK